MPSRHRSRERALQVLFQCDLRHQPVEDAIDAYYGSLFAEEEEEAESVPRDSFMEELARGTAANVAEIDRHISGHSEHWRLERMPAVDRNVLRLALFELMQGATPPAVVIDEALELARRFSGDEAVAFVNGVLDAARKDLGHKQEG